MRQLTFHGFTRKYVAELSLSGTTAIYPLTREATSNNPRLREPLFLYAVTNGNASTLLASAKDTGLFQDYASLLAEFDNPDKLMCALQQHSPALPEAYHKVWASYLSVSHKAERDARVKELIRRKVTARRKELDISTYRLCKDLKLNNANVNAWLKNGLANKVSLATARRILHYVETAQNELSSFPQAAPLSAKKC